MSRSPKAAARISRRQERRTAKKGVEIQSGADTIAVPPVRPMRAVVEPLNDAQRRYDVAIHRSRIVFGIGPAGTGKTWFATMRACEQLDAREIKKIFITRPAVEAEEEHGFLPGDLDEKFSPYLLPLLEALQEKFGSGHTEYLIKKKVIEARPLAFMRGTTFKDCVVILDEAQNMTPGQMKMFLSRIGNGATFIINGDPTQKDIPGPSGLIDGIDITRNIEGVEIVRFTSDDIVRDDICMDIIKAYEERKKLQNEE